MKINGQKLMKTAAAIATGITIGHVTQSLYDQEVVGEEMLNPLGKLSWKISEYWHGCTEKFKEMIE